MPGSPCSGLRKGRVLRAASEPRFRLSCSLRRVGLAIIPPDPLAKGDTCSHRPLLRTLRSTWDKGSEDAGRLLNLPVLGGVCCPGGRGFGLLLVLVSVAGTRAWAILGAGLPGAVALTPCPTCPQTLPPPWGPRGRRGSQSLLEHSLLPTSRGPFGDYPALPGTLFCLEHSGRSFSRFRPLAHTAREWVHRARPHGSLAAQLTLPPGGRCQAADGHTSRQLSRNTAVSIKGMPPCWIYKC